MIHGGYHENRGGVQYHGGYHDTCGGYHENRGSVQFHRGYHLLLFEYLDGAEHPHGIHDIPHMYHDIRTAVK